MENGTRILINRQTITGSGSTVTLKHRLTVNKKTMKPLYGHTDIQPSPTYDRFTWGAIEYESLGRIPALAQPRIWTDEETKENFVNHAFHLVPVEKDSTRLDRHLESLDKHRKREAEKNGS